ncbi:hypothetical protein HAX54_000245 [Datura stramonium]|uniref:Uncharacterized protein n=1 Tax=Datura stramonium TaxID=4076 RepID=A0ABS8T1X5_DATST|nr:hypothetical protein [Datura stramonium]
MHLAHLTGYHIPAPSIDIGKFHLPKFRWEEITAFGLYRTTVKIAKYSSRMSCAEILVKPWDNDASDCKGSEFGQAKPQGPFLLNVCTHTPILGPSQISRAAASSVSGVVRRRLLREQADRQPARHSVVTSRFEERSSSQAVTHKEADGAACAPPGRRRRAPSTTLAPPNRVESHRQKIFWAPNFVSSKEA